MGSSATAAAPTSKSRPATTTAGPPPLARAARIPLPSPAITGTEPLRLPSGSEVHVWVASLDSPAARAGAGFLLSRGEQARAARFHFDRDRHRFLARRLILRRLLGRYLGRNPAEVRFAHGPHGKPRLGGPEARTGLVFNVSFSHGTALFAFASRCQLGVDIERLPAPDDGDDVARHFFAPAEVETLRSLPTGERPAGFLRCWTRKEAYIKARGDGLSLPLDSFEVTLRPDEPPALVAARHAGGDAARWSLADLSDACPGHLAALAMDRPPPSVTTAYL